MGSTAGSLRSLTFATASVGYAAGDGGTVLKTTDGGATWLAVASPGGTLDLSRVRCADANLCLFATSAGSVIVRTSDGGATYAQITASARPLRAVAFASPTRAVAVGERGATVVSDDAGATWRSASTSTAGDFTSIAAASGGFAYAFGVTSIGLTSDGGATWTSVGIPTPRAISVAAFADPLTGYVQDDGTTLRRTVDGGTSWQILDPGPTAGPLQEIIALRGGRAILVTRTGVARTTNGGDSFAPVSSPVLTRSKVIRRGILAAGGSGRRAFVLGRAGILSSADAGASWTEVRLPRLAGRAPVLARADCIAPGTCWIVTTGSRMYRTTNLGGRWVEVTPAIGVPLRHVLRVAGAGPREAYLALERTPSIDEQGVLLHTTDGGLTWEPQLVDRLPLASLDAVPGRAWALAPINGVFTTSTGGRTATASTLTIAASKRLIARPTAITIRGRLKRAEGGEQVTLYAKGFAPRVLTAASSGSFTTTLTLKKTTTLVAQWAGDGVRSGDGTPVLEVRRR